jgi:ribonucleotide reductase alpha subunit
MDYKLKKEKLKNMSDTIFSNGFSEEVWKLSCKHYTDNNIDDSFKRVAKAVASVEKTEELKSLWESNFYELLTGFKITSSSRILANAGTDWKGTTLMSCFVGPKAKYDQDSIDGIFFTLLSQAKTLKAEGGWGMNFSFIRPRGSFIYGVGVETPGAVKYMEIFDTISDVITAGSGLKSDKKEAKQKIFKGAMMGILDCWHPDVEEFITAKMPHKDVNGNEIKKLQKFNLSVNCSNEFMDKVIKINELKLKNKPIPENLDKWELIFPNTQDLHYKEEWDGDIRLWKEKGYTIKVYKTVKISDLWELITKSTYTRNEPGVLFLDRANETHCWNYGGREAHIAATNPCISGDSIIKTDVGDVDVVNLIKKFEENKNIQILTYNETSKNTEYKNIVDIFKTKDNAEMIEIEDVNGNILKITPDHKVYVENKGWVESKNLKENDVLLEIVGKNIEKVKIKKISVSKNEDVYDIIVKDNHNFFANNVLVHNCGEQIMPFGSVCNLSSINLTQFYNENTNRLDLNKLKKYIPWIVRFLDNVNDLTLTPLKEYEESIKNVRRVGIGILGWGSVLYMMKVRYASDEAEKIKEEMMKVICYNAIDASIELAKEKGMFKKCIPEKHAEAEYFKKINLPIELKEKIKKYGIRNSALFSIQPTGITSVLSNVVSSGLEPIFLHEYIRTVIINHCPDEMLNVCPKYWEGEYKETEMFKWVKEGDESLLKGTDKNGTVYKIDKNRGLTKEVICADYGVKYLKSKNQWNEKAEWAVTTEDLNVEDHIKDLKGFGKWIDSSMSKTVGVPHNYSYEKFKNIYLDAYQTGCLKGITTYRSGTMSHVLSSVNKNEPSENKIYKTKAPKRPINLEAELYHFVLNKQKYYVAVGLMDKDPYEIFTGTNYDDKGNIVIPKDVKKGKIKKESGGRYRFITENEEYDLTNGHSDDNADALTRIISTALRHGSDVNFIVEQLEKTKGSMFSFSKILARTLKKYIENGTVIKDEKCPNCNSDLIRQEGCKKCKNCDYSACA